jgi:hypothetical protein
MSFMTRILLPERYLSRQIYVSSFLSRQGALELASSGPCLSSQDTTAWFVCVAPALAFGRMYKQCRFCGEAVAVVSRTYIANSIGYINIEAALSGLVLRAKRCFARFDRVSAD